MGRTQTYIQAVALDVAGNAFWGNRGGHNVIQVFFWV